MFEVVKTSNHLYVGLGKKIQLWAMKHTDKYRGRYEGYLYFYRLSVGMKEPRFIWRYRTRIQDCIRYHIPHCWYMVKTIAHITPIYVRISITDCDHCYYERVEKVKNGYRHYKAEKDFYENLENRGSITRISKEEYEEFESVSIDYVAEAHENGHPYNVRG